MSLQKRKLLALFYLKNGVLFVEYFLRLLVNYEECKRLFSTIKMFPMGYLQKKRVYAVGLLGDYGYSLESEIQYFADKITEKTHS